jgi:N-acetylglutamate synthase-like GNAT family acetyltransferase
MLLRVATLTDIDSVFSLLIELRRSGYTEMGEKVDGLKPGENAPGQYEELITRDDFHIILAEENRQIVALCVAYEFPKILDGYHRMVIEELVVVPRYRGRGIGKRLMEYMENLASEKNIKIVKVATGTELKANDFYRKLGYIHFENSYRKKL